MAKLHVSAIGIISTLAIANVSEAGPTSVAWSTPANGCLPAAVSVTDPSSAPGPDPTYGEVTFGTGSATGSFHLVCPITGLANITAPTKLVVVYQDQGSCQASGVLRYHSLTGTTSSSWTDTSFSGSNGGTGLHVATESFTETFDLDNYMYWVDLTLSRTADTDDYCGLNTISLTH